MNVRYWTCCGILAAALVGGLAASSALGTRNLRSAATFRVILRGAGNGAVTSMPRGLDCQATCSARFAENTTVILRALPRKGSRFQGWSGACVGRSALCILVARGTQTVSATFARKGGPFEDVSQVVTTRPVLNVTRAGPAGRIVSSPAGIDCPPVATCSRPFDRGHRVTLTAMAPKGAALVRWDGLLVNCPGKSSCSVTMNATTDVTATFKAIGE